LGRQRDGRSRDVHRDQESPKDDLIRQIEAEATKLPGNKVGFSHASLEQGWKNRS
jgi:hypothetical protein